MSNDLSGGAELERATPVPTPDHRPVAFVELITTAALALSTAVAITAVSIGMARAGVADAMVRARRAVGGRAACRLAALRHRRTDRRLGGQAAPAQATAR